MAVCVINMRDKKSKPEKQLMLSYGVLSFLLTLTFGLLVAALLGCIGALRENIKILYVHACFLIFIVSVEMIVGIGGAVLSAWMGGSNDFRVQFYKNSTNQCCGVDGPQDYAILEREIPVSCCARAHPLRDGRARRHLHSACLAEKTYYTNGCEEVMRQKKAFKGTVFISTGIIFSLLEGGR
ncbi:unnamed protein product [Leptidea sinapis]|uniref:Tetraspanin n=1 Tax=Leptidea sinapis TaxID=189913 RepID=A0A5E4QFZ4_9NEOP|nr:unnamed protein product [Leptidea sinapis]